MSDLWTTASTDATAATHQRVFASLRIEAAQYWNLLAGSESATDFGNRLALVAPQLDAIVSSHVKDAAEFITYRGELEASLTEDFAIVHEARQKTTYSAKVAGMDPIAYTYEADIHCPSCAEARFGRGADGFIGSDSTDSEGNPVGAVAPWDEMNPAGEVCGTCGGPISEPYDGTLASRKTAFDDDECYGCGYKGGDGWGHEAGGPKCPKCGSLEVHGPDAGKNWGKKDAKTAADYQGDRAARVNGNASLDQVQAYMPSNYTASQDADGTIWISGHDSAGWTLDGYVIPRLASGLISATEVEGSGPNDPANANATFASKTADADFNWGKAAQEILDQLVERGVSKEWLWEDGNWDAPTFVTVHGGTVKDIDSGKASVVDGKIRYNLTSSAFKTSSADLTNDDLQELADKGNELAAAMLRVRQDSGRGDDGSTPRTATRKYAGEWETGADNWETNEVCLVTQNDEPLYHATNQAASAQEIESIVRGSAEFRSLEEDFDYDAVDWQMVYNYIHSDDDVDPYVPSKTSAKHKFEEDRRWGDESSCIKCGEAKGSSVHTDAASATGYNSFSSKTATYVPCTRCFKPSLQVNASKALCRECQG